MSHQKCSIRILYGSPLCEMMLLRTILKECYLPNLGIRNILYHSSYLKQFDQSDWIAEHLMNAKELRQTQGMSVYTLFTLTSYWKNLNNFCALHNMHMGLESLESALKCALFDIKIRSITCWKHIEPENTIHCNGILL